MSDRQHALAPDKGTDRISHFTYDTARGAPHLRCPPRPPPSAPARDPVTSRTTPTSPLPALPRSWLPTLPPAFTGVSTAAEIRVCVVFSTRGGVR
ncbi:hypothetical protein ABZ464_44510 [Streptomyces sp. NPDC005820]|uniref:hypothetical protein n=1 Tax=Streptomyces sp. NPDC005820 TaxID=3157069 RepID=UPI0033F7FA37